MIQLANPLSASSDNTVCEPVCIVAAQLPNQIPVYSLGKQTMARVLG